MINKKYICLIALCLWLVPAVALAKDSTPPAINAQGLQQMLSMNKGKVVLINFFATWCPPCREEIPGLVSLAKNYPADKFVIIGISVDQDAALVKPFMQKMGVNYSVFMAEEDIPALYGVRTIPHNVVYDRSGKLAANAPGYVAEADIREFIDTLLEQK